jgi:hypothetical protein
VTTQNWCIRRKTPAKIQVRKRCQHAWTLRFILTLAEKDQLHDNALEAICLCLRRMFQDPEDLLPPRAVHRLAALAFETVVVQQATDSLPQRSLSRERAVNSIGEEEPPPASPVVYCSQYRMEEYEQQNGPLPGNEKVGEWLRNVETACGGAGQQSCFSVDLSESLVMSGTGGRAWLVHQALALPCLSAK